MQLLILFIFLALGASSTMPSSVAPDSPASGGASELRESQEDTRIRTDAARLMAALQEHASNNLGQYPPTLQDIQQESMPDIETDLESFTYRRYKTSDKQEECASSDPHCRYFELSVELSDGSIYTTDNN